MNDIFKLKPHRYNKTFFGSLKGGFKFYARKLYLFKNYKTFEKIVNKFPSSRAFFARNEKSSNDILHRKYGCNAFSYQYGYECLENTIKVILNKFENIFEKSYLLCTLNDEFTVYMRSGSRMLNEGVFTIYIRYQNECFFDMNFIITKENDFMITCLQGYTNTSDMVKIFTKEFFGLRPVSFFINFAYKFKDYLQLNKLLGVDDKYLVSGFKRGKFRKNREYIINDYNMFWDENCDIIAKHKGYFEIVPSRKNIDEIPSKKRSMYKKRFDFLDNLQLI